MKLKVYDIKYGFIVPMGSAITHSALYKFHRMEIKAGKYIGLWTAWRRLKRALKEDDYLMADCIKLAVERKHKIY